MYVSFKKRNPSTANVAKDSNLRTQKEITLFIYSILSEFI
jgi:hypothetical protein